MQAEIYTKTDCKYCIKAKELLKERQIAFKEFIISAGFDETPLADNQYYVSKDDLLNKLPTATKVPQIWLNGRHIGGYTELAAYFSRI
jgi:glutaredoxin 3